MDDRVLMMEAGLVAADASNSVDIRSASIVEIARAVFRSTCCSRSAREKSAEYRFKLGVVALMTLVGDEDKSRIIAEVESLAAILKGRKPAIGTFRPIGLKGIFRDAESSRSLSLADSLARLRSTANELV